MPAVTITANERCHPVSPPPKAVTHPDAITIRPAAGPFIDKRDPEKKLTITPPTIAVTNPYIAGNSLALLFLSLKEVPIEIP